ncbi:MAG: hypothetical protein ABIO92_06655 [Chloroflexia bacterium]
MNNMVWIIYAVVVLVISGVIGLHLGKFREAYTEMTGMMAGMMMGMLNGFLLGYAAGAATGSMFWGNLIGIILGLSMGVYYGRAGSLMGMMDGGMGGVMGGSMGAMLAVMVYFPEYGLYWTAVVLALIYIAGMLGLVVLIEQSAPDHAALHRFLPMFARAMAVEAAEEADRSARSGGNVPSTARPLPIVDYYALLGLPTQAVAAEINEAYLAKLAIADGASIDQLERAVTTLADPNRRRAYDVRLRACCPPPKKARVQAAQPAQVLASVPVGSAGKARNATQVVASAVPISTQRKETTMPVKGQANRPKNGKQPAASRPEQATVNLKVRPRQPNATYRQEQARSPRQEPSKRPPISGIGIFMGALLVAVLVGWWAMSNGGTPQVRGANNSTLPQMGHIQGVPDQNAGGQAAIDAEAVSAQIVDGVQTVDFVVIGDSMSYRPSVIKVKQGMPVRFNVSVEGRDPG